MNWLSLQILLSANLLIVLTSCHKMYDVNLVPHECIENRAVAANYTPLGQVVQVGNLPIYQYQHPDNRNSNRMLVGVYDIYGFAYDNIKQVMDQVAVQNGGFRVILPDFYRGDSVNPNFTAAERAEWMQRVGDWETIVKPDLINIVNHYRNEGVTEFAIFGFCWGGKVSTLASIELSKEFKASALIHPSSVTTEEAFNVTIPMYLMPTQSENDMLPFYEILKSKFADNCGHRRFDDMVHGFAGARGDFSNPLIQERVNEVINRLGVFFDRNLSRLSSNSNNLQPSAMIIVTFIVTFIFFVTL